MKTSKPKHNNSIRLDPSKLLGNTLKGTTMVGETKPAGLKPNPT